MQDKIFDIEQLAEEVRLRREAGEGVVLADGHFNIVHPGHQRFLRFCREKGDFLVVGVMSPDMLDPTRRDFYFPQDERAANVAAFALVDAVCLLEGSSADLIRAIRPDYYVKGVEFQRRPDELAPAVEALDEVGGKLIFGSGGASFAAGRVVPRFPGRRNHKYQSFLTTCARYDIGPADLREGLAALGDTNICVIGDTIVDNFIACDPLGISSEAPVLTIRELDAERFLGGAAIVAQIAQALGGSATFVSVLGEDETADWAEQRLSELGLEAHLLRDPTRPTTFKTRYVVDNHKVLRVSRLREHQLSRQLEDQLIARIREVVPRCDGVVLSDFVYGVLTPRVIEAAVVAAREAGARVFADLQCSSQTGDVSKYRDVCLITPTEKEARTALADQTSGLEQLAHQLVDKTGNEHVFITLGAQGLLINTQVSGINRTAHSEYLCALSSSPVDVAGAGDALLATAALALSSHLNVICAAALGSLAAAVAVSRVGNIPVSPSEVAALLADMAPHQLKYSPERADRSDGWSGIFDPVSQEPS